MFILPNPVLSTSPCIDFMQIALYELKVSQSLFKELIVSFSSLKMLSTEF